MKNFISLALFGLCCVLISFFIFQICSKEKPAQSNLEAKSDTIKKQISKGFIKKDSIHLVSKKQDSIRIVYVTKWRELKAETELICGV